MLWQMEVEVGLETLPQPQKDVYYAACLVADDKQLVHSDVVKHQPILALMSRPTFYRALKSLVEKNLLVHAGPHQDGRYFVKR
ncbi:hypothetical protein SKA53_00649 [Yoonia vestfoldensis SKA53]|uniref:Uncharacterized protein n=2 Tax=Yoonia vestfoldensis TaxID=245188 RepID=A3V898_9RHOB|nr:hypothetical protein SKA53_00649 [Yoonia vestfoldensis SKA53]